MDDLFVRYAPYAFPVFFVGMWLFVSTLLSAFSGWFVLMSRFPNRQQAALLKISHLSGSMGLGVHMNGILTLSACPGGLRVGIWRIFGPFSRDFFVPWSELTIARRNGFFGPRAELQFGRPTIGRLRIDGHIADRLGHAVAGHWPESAPLPPPETMGQIVRRLGFQWLIMTVLAAAFFSIPLLSAPANNHPPIVIAILFPAVVFGIATVVRFLAAAAGRR